MMQEKKIYYITYISQILHVKHGYTITKNCVPTYKQVLLFF